MTGFRWEGKRGTFAAFPDDPFLPASGGFLMATLTRCPHCSGELSPFHADPHCAHCGGDFLDESCQAVNPPPDLAPAEGPPGAAPKPAEGPFSAGSLLLSLFIALLLGASFELMSHASAGARFGNGRAILFTLIGALVIHAARMLLFSGDRDGVGLGLAFVALLIGLYTHYDEKWFAARRPWNLVLAALLVAGGVVVLTGFVFALLRMFESKSERAMGKTCLGLGLTGLGVLLAMGWGWRLLYREDSPIAQDKKDRHFRLMLAWTGGLVVQLAILGYVWYKAPPGRGIIPPYLEPPVAVYTEPAVRNERGLFYRVRLVNTSDKPLYGMKWAAFTSEEWRVKEDKRRMARWQPIPALPPGGSYDLPNVFDAGWIFEFDAGNQGVKVHKLTGR
jgi:hypothetical protein